jgi:hypothetical protein
MHHHQHKTRSGGFAATSHSANAAFTLLTLDRHFPSVARANSVIDPETGLSLEYAQLRQGPDGEKWTQAAANEFGRLAQGVLPHMPTGTDTIRFIAWNNLPAGKRATYIRYVASLRPNKADVYRLRATVGGNLIDYKGNVSTPTADITTFKVHVNSTISTPGARHMTIDCKDFYLNSEMEEKEYMRIHIRDIPQCIIDQYHLTDYVNKAGYVLVEIGKGMYGLPQAGILAHRRLTQHLAKHGYSATEHTPGLFTHSTRPISFCLVVDDFSVSYVGREHAEHLVQCISEIYEVTTDWTASKFLGLTLDWDYEGKTVDLSMPGYIANALHKFQHPLPKRPEDSPHAWLAPTYGTTTQLTPPLDDSPPLDAAGTTRRQEIIGTLLYYARAVDPTMLVALGTLASAQANGTEAAVTAMTQLLNYCATHPDAVIRYHASDMQLHVHSDASYLSEKYARSRSAGIFFLSSTAPATLPDPDDPPPPFNGAIHVHSAIIKAVMSSATEAETGALFYNCKDGAVLRQTLEDMGHPQGPTLVQTDNACAAGIANATVKQRRSKAINMRFYWVRDRVKQGQFIIHWKRGRDNLADYFSKHHSAAHHRLMRSRYLLELHTPQQDQLLRGCVDPGSSDANQDPETKIQHLVNHVVRTQAHTYATQRRRRKAFLASA